MSLRFKNINASNFKKIKTVFLDIDGTLSNSQRIIPQRVIDSVKRINTKCEVILVTGRPFKGALDAYNLLNLHSKAIVTLNGGAIFDSEFETIYLDEMTLKENCSLLDLQKFIPCTLNFFTAREWYCTNTNDPIVIKEEDIVKFPAISIQSLNFVKNTPFSKYLIFAQKEDLIKAYPIMEKMFPDRIRIHVYHDYFEIFSKTSSKGAGVAFVQDKFNFKKDECLAIGDTENDLYMFQEVGIGVLMDNGDRALEKYANCLTSSSDECGVAEVLDYLYEQLK